MWTSSGGARLKKKADKSAGRGQGQRRGNRSRRPAAGSWHKDRSSWMNRFAYVPQKGLAETKSQQEDLTSKEQATYSSANKPNDTTSGQRSCSSSSRRGQVQDHHASAEIEIPKKAECETSSGNAEWPQVPNQSHRIAPTAKRPLSSIENILGPHPESQGTAFRGKAQCTAKRRAKDCLETTLPPTKDTMRFPISNGTMYKSASPEQRETSEQEQTSPAGTGRLGNDRDRPLKGCTVGITEAPSQAHTGDRPESGIKKPLNLKAPFQTNLKNAFLTGTRSNDSSKVGADVLLVPHDSKDRDGDYEMADADDDQSDNRNERGRYDHDAADYEDEDLFGISAEERVCHSPMLLQQFFIQPDDQGSDNDTDCAQSSRAEATSIVVKGGSRPPGNGVIFIDNYRYKSGECEGPAARAEQDYEDQCKRNNIAKLKKLLCILRSDTATNIFGTARQGGDFFANNDHNTENEVVSIVEECCAARGEPVALQTLFVMPESKAITWTAESAEHAMRAVSATFSDYPRLVAKYQILMERCKH